MSTFSSSRRSLRLQRTFVVARSGRSGGFPCVADLTPARDVRGPRAVERRGAEGRAVLQVRTRPACSMRRRSCGPTSSWRSPARSCGRQCGSTSSIRRMPGSRASMSFRCRRSAAVDHLVMEIGERRVDRRQIKERAGGQEGLRAGGRRTASMPAWWRANGPTSSRPRSPNRARRGDHGGDPVPGQRADTMHGTLSACAFPWSWVHATSRAGRSRW